MKRPPRHRLAYAARGLAASVATFAALLTFAVAEYPGGTWADHATRGYDPLHNFICDLLEPVALDGEPNGGAAGAAVTAMLVMAVGLSLAWWFLPSTFPAARRLGVAVRALGLVSVAGIVAVPLAPATRWYWSHAAAVLIAGVSGLAAATAAVTGLARARARALAWLGGTTIAVALVDVVLYGYQLVVVGNPSPWLSLFEGVATLALLAWLGAIALHFDRSVARARGAETRTLPRSRCARDR